MIARTKTSSRRNGRSPGARPQRASRSRANGPRALGPRDAGRVMRERDYLRCVDAPGYVSEIIDGVVCVSPSGKAYHHSWQSDIGVFLAGFARQHSVSFNHVMFENDVVIAGRPGATRPRPDIAVYRNFPRAAAYEQDFDGASVCPVLVVEVISRRRPRKDVGRNRELYWYAGGIAEYWIVDTRPDAAAPTLRALVRESGQKNWVEHEVPFGQAYRSAAFPGLTINLRELIDSITRNP